MYLKSFVRFVLSTRIRRSSAKIAQLNLAAARFCLIDTTQRSYTSKMAATDVLDEYRKSVKEQVIGTVSKMRLSSSRLLQKNSSQPFAI